jgi:hypothetical protein
MHSISDAGICLGVLKFAFRRVELEVIISLYQGQYRAFLAGPPWSIKKLNRVQKEVQSLKVEIQIASDTALVISTR